MTKVFIYNGHLFPKNLTSFCYNVKVKISYFSPGGVVEWFKALVLKTSVSARVPWVRIPPPPYLKEVRKSQNISKFKK